MDSGSLDGALVRSVGKNPLNAAGAARPGACQGETESEQMSAEETFIVLWAERSARLQRVMEQSKLRDGEPTRPKPFKGGASRRPDSAREKMELDPEIM